MAKMNLELLEGETLIGFETVCMQRGWFIFTQTDNAKLYITDQRIHFSDITYHFTYTLDEISCFSCGSLGSTCLYTKEGKKHIFSTSSAKQVRNWLRLAKIAEA